LIGTIFFSTKPNWFQVLGALISITGVCVVLSRGELQALLQVQLVFGDLLMVLATVLWAFYSWMLSRPGASNERQWPWADFLMAQVFIGLLWTGLFEGIEIASGHAYLDLNLWTGSLILFVAIGPSLIAYRCWGLGVTGAGPTVAAFFANFIPLFTALLSAAILGEPPSLFHGAAFALIVAGIWVSSPKNRST
jgi:drug/metabolite transporter (DMT)-like permease